MKRRATFSVLQILGIEGCADTIIGNDMIRGISGGQKRRVTTGRTNMKNDCLDTLPRNSLFEVTG